MHAHACTLYQELAVTIVHKIVTSLTTDYCIVNCDEYRIHGTTTLSYLPGIRKLVHILFHGNPIILYRDQSLGNCHLGVHNAAGCSADVDVVGQHDKFNV